MKHLVQRLLAIILLLFTLQLSAQEITLDSFPKPGPFVDSLEVMITFDAGTFVTDEFKVFKKRYGKYVPSRKLNSNGIWVEVILPQVDRVEFYRIINGKKRFYPNARIKTERPFIIRNTEN